MAQSVKRKATAGLQFPAEARDGHSVQTDSGAPRASYPTGKKAKASP
jgi:hypothetical protein